MKKIIISIIMLSGVASVAAQAPTNHYPNVAGTITRPGYVYKYRNERITGVEDEDAIELYNADNTFLDVKRGRRDGTPFTKAEILGQVPDKYYFSYISHTYDQLRALVNSIFTSQQRSLLAGSSMLVMPYLNPITGRVVDVVFVFWRDEPLVNIPVETYRAIELALKQNLTATATEIGKEFNYYSFIWEHEFESPTTPTELIPGAITRATQTIDSGMIPDMDIESISGGSGAYSATWMYRSNSLFPDWTSVTSPPRMYSGNATETYQIKGLVFDGLQTKETAVATVTVRPIQPLVSGTIVNETAYLYDGGIPKLSLADTSGANSINYQYVWYYKSLSASTWTEVSSIPALRANAGNPTIYQFKCKVISAGPTTKSAETPVLSVAVFQKLSMTGELKVNSTSIESGSAPSVTLPTFSGGIPGSRVYTWHYQYDDSGMHSLTTTNPLQAPAITLSDHRPATCTMFLQIQAGNESFATNRVTFTVRPR